MVPKDCFDCEDGIVRADLRGRVTDQIWSYVFCKTLALAGIYETRNLLIDLRQAQVPVNPFAVLSLPPALEYIGLTRLYRIALVVDYRENDYSFYETVFRNRGFALQIFTDYEEARNWFSPNIQPLDFYPGDSENVAG